MSTDLFLFYHLLIVDWSDSKLSHDIKFISIIKIVIYIAFIN